MAVAREFKRLLYLTQILTHFINNDFPEFHLFTPTDRT